MNTSGPTPDPRVVQVAVERGYLTVELADGRRVSAPLSWFPRLMRASPEQRAHWILLGDGRGVHWPDVDEDLSVEGLLRGASAPGTSRGAV